MNKEELQAAIKIKLNNIIENFDPDPYTPPEIKKYKYLNSIYKKYSDPEQARLMELIHIFTKKALLSWDKEGVTFARGIVYGIRLAIDNKPWKKDADNYMNLLFWKDIG